MIVNTSQKWQAGQTVKVGFMVLTVVSCEPTPGDYRPDIYHLISSKGVKYTFTPHFGLERV